MQTDCQEQNIQLFTEAEPMDQCKYSTTVLSPLTVQEENCSKIMMTLNHITGNA